MPRVAAFVVAVVVACAAAAGGFLLYANSTGEADRAAPPPETGQPRIVPAPGQAFVTGTVEHLFADGSQGGSLATPFTLDAPERGGGGVSIENALVGGKRTTVVWGGGTSLPMSGSGGLDLDGASVEVDSGHVTWSLPDGESRPLQPGSYRAGAPVAVGEAGLAASQDGVAFVADADTVINARGRVVVRLPPMRLELTGPGRVSARGNLQVVTDASTRPATLVELADGPFQVRLVPREGTLTLDAVFQGPLTTR